MIMPETTESIEELDFEIVCASKHDEEAVVIFSHIPCDYHEYMCKGHYRQAKAILAQDYKQCPKCKKEIIDTDWAFMDL